MLVLSFMLTLGLMLVFQIRTHQGNKGKGGKRKKKNVNQMPWFPGDEMSFKTKSSFTEQKERKFISRQILLIFLDKTKKFVSVHACNSMQVCVCV